MYIMMSRPQTRVFVQAPLQIGIQSQCYREPDVSVESVGSSFPRVILIGSIFVEVPVAPEVGTAAVASPTGVLELDTHSSLEADPSESSLPPVSVVVAPRKFQVMAAPVISISSDVSVESVGSSFLRVILIGFIFVKVPVASDVGATAVASPAGVLEFDTHSSSEADPSKSSLPPVFVAPMVSPFLCSDNLESDTEIPERYVSPTPHEAILTRWRTRVELRSSSPTTSTPEIPVAPILPSPSAIVALSSEFPLASVVAHPGFVDYELFLSDPGRTFLLVDFTVLILMGYVGH
ncbi:hypothetical protein Tco_0403306 [Tanacetum coccineum]